MALLPKVMFFPPTVTSPFTVPSMKTSVAKTESSLQVPLKEADLPAIAMALAWESVICNESPATVILCCAVTFASPMA